MSAYQIWSKDNREAVKKDNQDANPAKMMTLLAEGWKKVTETTKVKYEKEAKILKDKYKVAMEEYKKNKPTSEEESEGDDKKKKSKKDKKKKDPNAPKRALSNYMLYSQDKRPSVKEDQPSLTLPEIGKLLGQMWKDESEEVKAKYTKKAVKAKEEYTVALAKYNATKPKKDSESEEEEKPKKKVAKKEEKKPKKEEKKAPKKKEEPKKKDDKKKKVEVSESEEEEKTEDESEEDKDIIDSESE